MSPTASSGATKGQSRSQTELAKSLHLIDSIFVRHKNQHRRQAWWIPLSLIRKALRKYVVLQARENKLKTPIRTAGAIQAVQDAENVRRRFEVETQVRREREMLGAWIRNTLCPRCYVAFSGLVADTQFTNLGMVLMGVLAEIAGVVGLPQASGEELEEDGSVVRDAQATTRQARSVTAHSLQAVGAERGTLVERIYDSDDLGEVIERHRDSPEVRESLRTSHADHDIRRLSVSVGAKEKVGGGTFASPKAQPPGDNPSQDDDIEMEEDSVAVDAFCTVTTRHKSPTAKAQKSAAQRSRNRNATQAIREKRTKKSAVSLQPTSIASTPPSSLFSKEHSSTATPPLAAKRQLLSGKINSPPKPAIPEAFSKQKGPVEGEEPELVENRTKKTTKSSGTDKSKSRKKKNAIDDMFAGFG
ncbi:uncharacterized protein A1O9_03322 [Exophiala aquamarina CBS 119918]|uniref:RNase MRP protein 1 RNA binding domain-containing protein n=1 Tax=Exophiala aquamarina CBS 119918 TaxID=1182545 RepID=A0A072PPU7_9EURO|nr:uncharacterized protein A1O9_03322 [Exophiala aquamarina CBS 119918]KEF61752.1 hypothetical protein A1O9_03322 [Exophiala aquamarina CBS 119918]